MNPQSRTPNSDKNFADARHHYALMYRMQAPQLHHHQEQEEDHRASGDEEILPLVPGPHEASGNEIGLRTEDFAGSWELGTENFD